MIELAITDHSVPLLELKARTRARIDRYPQRLSDHIESELYEVGDLCIRYVLTYKRRGARFNWKGVWTINWSPIGENALFGKLRALEGR